LLAVVVEDGERALLAGYEVEPCSCRTARSARTCTAFSRNSGSFLGQSWPGLWRRSSRLWREGDWMSAARGQRKRQAPAEFLNLALAPTHPASSSEHRLSLRKAIG